MEQTEQHILTVENCKKVTATAITSVDSFSATQLVLSYAQGRIIIGGSDMKIVNFSKSTGAFAATGNITQAKYAQRGASIRQRLFK